jgi:polyisoprenoid-binding protein YceI
VSCETEELGNEPAKREVSRKGEEAAMHRRLTLRLLSAALILAGLSTNPSGLLQRPPTFAMPLRSDAAIAPSDGARYRIDAGQSRFIVRAFAGGFLSALAHDHTIAIREFTGEAAFTYGTVEPASLQMTIQAGSLAVIDKISESDRQKIQSTMRDEVLEASKYPEIIFKSTGVAATRNGEGQYQARISGELTLHGVTRPLTITAQLEFGDRMLRAKGAFSLKQTSFDIKPVSIAGGTIKVKDELKFTFEIVAH